MEVRRDACGIFIAPIDLLSLSEGGCTDKRLQYNLAYPSFDQTSHRVIRGTRLIRAPRVKVQRNPCEY